MLFDMITVSLSYNLSINGHNQSLLSVQQIKCLLKLPLSLDTDKTLPAKNYFTKLPEVARR